MSLASRLAVPLFVLAPLIAATPARADATADGAAALQAQIRAWVTDLTGPAVDLGSHAVRVTPAGDAYRFELPVTGPVGNTGWVITGEPIAAIAKPVENGSWTITSIELPTPLHADRSEAPDGKPYSWMLALAGQQFHGRFDPTLATSSHFDGRLHGYSSLSETAAGTHSSHYDSYVWNGGWVPAGDRRVTVSHQVQGHNLTVFIDAASRNRTVTATVGSISSSGRIERLSFERLGDIVRTVSGLVPSAMQAAGTAAAPKSISPADRTRLHALVAALRDLLGGVQAQTKMERIGVDIGGQRGTLASLTIGSHAAAPGGMLDASLNLAVEGFDSPLVPPGPLHGYLPHRVALTPRLSGVPAGDLMSLLDRAIDDADKDSLQAQALGLLAKGPLKVGLEDVAMDLGAATLKANGSVTVAALNDIKGSARIDATGLDTLIHSANTVPELASAAPFLIMLKGIGEQKGDTTTWNVTYADGHAMVNGTDLSALMPSSPATPDQPHIHK